MLILISFCLFQQLQLLLLNLLLQFLQLNFRITQIITTTSTTFTDILGIATTTAAGATGAGAGATCSVVVVAAGGVVEGCSSHSSG